MSVDFGFTDRELEIVKRNLAIAMRHEIDYFESRHYEISGADGCDLNLVFNYAAKFLQQGPTIGERNVLSGKNIRRLFWEEKEKGNVALASLIEEKLCNNDYVQTYKYNTYDA
ncbi:hypothetical protein TKK_0015553 [Trichogramma kaykai]|uniref:Uncharacterized protein n=1 Tax=Trichogramma kaykai TaxID=54128 RepID=A0ABD2WA32_9HYME